MTIVRREPAPRDEELDIELPPVDDDCDSESSDADDEAEALLGDDDDADLFDDAAASDLDTGIDLEALEADSALAEGDADADFDIGEIPLIGGAPGESALDDQPNGEDSEETGLFENAGGLEDDGGVDGVDNDDDDDGINENDYPVLGDMDENAEDTGDLLRDLEIDDTLASPREGGWVVVEGVGTAVPCSSVAVSNGFVAAGGTVLLVVKDGEVLASKVTFAARSEALAFVDGTLVIAKATGEIVATDDFGATFVALGTWTPRRVPIRLSAGTGRLWIVANGGLWVVSHLSPRPASAQMVVESGVVAAVAVEGGLLALRDRQGITVLERIAGDDAATVVWTLPKAEAGSRLQDVRIAAAAGGRSFAFANRTTLWVSRDEAHSFSRYSLTDIAGLAFTNETTDAPIIAVARSEQGATSYALFEIDEDGALTKQVELGDLHPDSLADADDGPGSIGLAWDASRELAWVAAPAGLFALRRRQKH